MRRSWYRLDNQMPDEWTWESYPTPQSRFDSAIGAGRVRYAADAPRTAMRERFDREERRIDAVALRMHVVELSGTVAALDLRRDRTLDALGLDDQINTGRAPGVWAACHRLADLVQDWFGPRCGGIVYRSRTTPQQSANLAFFSHAALRARDLGPLITQESLLAECVLSDGFTVQGWR